jgi:cell division protein FtsB
LVVLLEQHERYTIRHMKPMKVIQRGRGTFQKRTVQSGMWFAGLLFLAVLLAQGAVGVYMKHRESEARLQETAATLEAVEQRIAGLEDEIAYLETPQGMEREIRTKFSVARPGEKVVVVLDSPKPEASVVEEEPGFFGRIRGWFAQIGR